MVEMQNLVFDKREQTVVTEYRSIDHPVQTREDALRIRWIKIWFQWAICYLTFHGFIQQKKILTKKPVLFQGKNLVLTSTFLPVLFLKKMRTKSIINATNYSIV